ncbi:hypothetical protein CR983_02770 [Candidatus Saccharibacteria bacterium]|nr:MAG: hypothetical protein CR983_02770 [Candidatus Saccharibacteria bacterium]
MRIIVEADSIAQDTMSGIGHATLQMIKSLRSELKDSRHQLVIVVPFGKKSYVRQHGLDVKIRTLPPGYRYINFLLARSWLTIPAELLFGRGVYIFPNYKTWWTPFSKSITFVHDIAYKLYPETIQPSNLRYLRANMGRWLKRTTYTVSISRQSQRELIKSFPRFGYKSKMIYLGVDQSFFAPQDQLQIDAVKTKYALPPVYFLYVGNIEPRKNLTMLLDAYETYITHSRGIVGLVLVGGNGWKNAEIIQRIGSLVAAGAPIVRPNTYVQDADLPALYSGANALVLVSLHEGYGLSAVQAQSCGTPVIVSDLPVFHETLDSTAATFVSSREELVSAFAAHTGPERVGHTTPPQMHTWQQTAKKIIDLTGIMK